jgi:hypothetical protein
MAFLPVREFKEVRMAGAFREFRELSEFKENTARP